MVAVAGIAVLGLMSAAGLAKLTEGMISVGGVSHARSVVSAVSMLSETASQDVGGD